MIQKHSLEDFRINTKIKLAALWASVMFCYVYGDFFSLFVPGRIKNLMDGHSGAGDTTPGALFAFALLMTIPSLMIFLSVALKPTVNRWANIIAGIFFTLVMLLIGVTSLDKWMIFYVYLAFIEVILTTTIVWHAWNWPRKEP